MYMTEHGLSSVNDAQRTIPIVYFAKKVSERAQGVGRLTDLLIFYGRKENDGKESYKLINMDKGLPNNKIMDLLDKAFDDIEEFKHKSIENMAVEINKMIMGGQTSSTPVNQSPNNETAKSSS